MQCRSHPFSLLLRTTLLRDFSGVCHHIFTRRKTLCRQWRSTEWVVLCLNQYWRKSWQFREYLPAKSQYSSDSAKLPITVIAALKTSIPLGNSNAITAGPHTARGPGCNKSTSFSSVLVTARSVDSSSTESCCF